MEGLALIADWNGNYQAKEQFEDKAYQIRIGVEPISFHCETLINHEQDWDMTLTLSREPSVDETKLPFAIAKDGIKLIGDFESLLRNPKAQ